MDLMDKFLKGSLWVCISYRTKHYIEEFFRKTGLFQFEDVLNRAFSSLSDLVNERHYVWIRFDPSDLKINVYSVNPEQSLMSKKYSKKYDVVDISEFFELKFSITDDEIEELLR